MSEMSLVTGNHAAGHALSRAGEANREARGSVSGIYPITPQTEIVEYVSKFPFSKGKVIPVESEHSAMAVCIGASLYGARSFTASSSNGLAYMAENVIVAGFYRLPIVMATVNRTLGPPWNIWADQGDTLFFRDMPWVQFYCNTNQEVHDTTLLSFRLAEAQDIMLPVMLAMDAFIVSHTVMETKLATQEEADAYLPHCSVPHRLRPEKPFTIGGLVWPTETQSQRMEIDEAMQNVPAEFEKARKEFSEIFGREVPGAVEGYQIEDAKALLIASGTVATTAKTVVDEKRAKGEKMGLLRINMFRPFPTQAVLSAIGKIPKVAVLDRNYAAGSGGIFWGEVRMALQGQSHQPLVQNYLTGVGGGDVTPPMIHEVVEDLLHREKMDRPIWKGVQS